MNIIATTFLDYVTRGNKVLFTNTDASKKIFIMKIFLVPLQTSKNFSPPPPRLFGTTIMGQLRRKAYKLIFYWKICGNFYSKSPLQGSKILRAPFLHQPPPNKCSWTVPKILKLNICAIDMLSMHVFNQLLSQMRKGKRNFYVSHMIFLMLNMD